MDQTEQNEGGEPTVPSNATSKDIEQTSNSVQVQPSGQRIEIDLLCLDSLAKIAREMAIRVQKNIPENDRGLILVTPNLLNKINVHRKVTAQISLLQRQLDQNQKEATLEPPTQIELASLAAVTTAISGFKDFISDIGSLLSILQGVEPPNPVGAKPIAESALISTLAGQLSQRGFKIMLPGVLDPQPKVGKGIVFQLAELWDKKELAAKIKDPNDAAKDTISTVEGLFSWLQKIPEGKQQPSLLCDLIAVDGISTLIAENSAFIVVSEIVANGGSYRVRNSLISRLFRGNALSYCGGVAVSFLLLEGDSLTLRTSDTLYYSTGYTEFPTRCNLFNGDNL